MHFTIKSPAFSNNEHIPREYTSDGKNISPPLEWENAPESTKSFVLIVDDYDAPGGLFNHWIIYNIPHTVNKLSEGQTHISDSAGFGVNNFGVKEYRGPRPPYGEHSYHFRLFALNDTIQPHNEKMTRNNIEKIIEPHIIAKAVLIGRYTKQDSPKDLKIHHDDVEDAHAILRRKDIDESIKENARDEIENDALDGDAYED